MTDAKEKFKVLFVGKKHICQQVAYVLDVRDYALVKKLTVANFDQYHDSQIYICDFKKKSHKYVKFKPNRRDELKLQYLDDICHIIDKKSAAYRHYKGEVDKVKSSVIDAAKRYQYRKISKDDLKYLFNLKPSELFLYVLKAPINKNIFCTRIEGDTVVRKNGDFCSCCSVAVPFGNLLSDGELDEIYNGIYARIVKLSSLNGSYCLCNSNRWCKGYCLTNRVLPTKQLETDIYPKKISLNFDRSCNLCCKSCRNEHYIMNNNERQSAEKITKKLLDSGYLEQAQILRVAGMGEVFYSTYYCQIISTDSQRKNISIFSNGTLFNENNWRLLADKYKIIDVSISVDAATAETYQKIRGANFNKLMDNLKMLADFHHQGQIRNYTLNFLIQRDNFREMADFVRLGRMLGANKIDFQRMSNFGNYTTQEFLDRCLVVDNKYLDYELWCVLQDPIFKDPIVDLRGLQRYIDASESRYRQRYMREQKQHVSV